MRRVLFLMPSLESVYAARFIFEGLRNAFVDLGHEFRPLTAEDDLTTVLEEFRPDVLLYSLNFYHLKFLDLDVLRSHREEGLVVFCQIRSWHGLPDTISPGGVPVDGLKDHKRHVRMVADGSAGDVFWHWFEQEEPLMEGFTETTGRTFSTIHLAADRTMYYPDFNESAAGDIAFVGSYLPEKRTFLRENVLPLRAEYDLRIYGHDWTRTSRVLGHAQRAGQFLNIKPLKGIRKLSLSLESERQLYSSSKICLNVHEQHQRRTGSDVNERTFKIPACGGFQLCDDVALVHRLFPNGEVPTAGTNDWREQIEHYLRAPEERMRLATAAKEQVLAHHTYHHRAEQILEIAETVRQARPT